MINATLLEQTRLDVLEKSRSNIFNWRGQFTPQLVEYLLDAFTSPGSLVVDPFCGSGTVLLEAAARKMSCFGCEINPAAYAMSRFIGLGKLSINQRAQLFRRVQDEVFSMAKIHQGVPLFEKNEDFRERYKNLLAYAAALFATVEGKRELLLALIVLMRAESNGRGDLSSALRKACVVTREDLYNLPFSDKPIDVELRDARMAHEKLQATADLIITSPPYINVFNYHQNFRALLEVVGFDILKVAESEIGSNRKNRGNRFRTVVQYALDMEQCIASLGLSLKDGGVLILVVGHESNVRGIPFSNSGILREVANSLGCFRLKGERHRIFLNRFGKSIREDILILDFTGDLPVKGAARHIAEKTLKDALDRAEGEPYEDIVAALSEIHTISASPMFTKKGII